MRITFSPNDKGYPAGKLADAELHFDERDGALAGLKLIGFTVWERRGGGANVTFPARQYAVGGERRSFSLLRAVDGSLDATYGLRDTIIDAWRRHERGEAAQPTLQPAGEAALASTDTGDTDWPGF